MFSVFNSSQTYLVGNTIFNWKCASCSPLADTQWDKNIYKISAIPWDLKRSLMKSFPLKRSPKGHLEKQKHLQNLCKCLIINVDQPELIHGISLSLLAKYLPFCIDSLCSRNVAANWLVYDRYSDYLLKAHSLSSSEYKVRTFCLYLQIFVI